MYVIGYPKSGNGWICQLLTYCFNTDFDDWDAKGIHIQDEMSKQYLSGGHAHASFREQVGTVWKTHRNQFCRHDYKPSIYLLRDGKDVMVSYYFYLFEFLKRGNKPTFSDFLRTYTSEWVEHVVTGLDWGPNAIIRYEDVQEKQAGALEPVFESLGFNISAKVIQEALDIFSFRNFSGGNPGEGNNESFYRKGIVGDWVNYFSESDLKYYQKIAGNLSKQLGYQDFTYSEFLK